MKKITIPVYLAAFLAFGSGCNSNKGSDSSSADSVQSTTSSSTMTTDTSANNTNNTGTAAAGTAGTGTGAAADTGMAADQGFIMDAASGGLMEVELGKTTSANAASAKVKQFGQMMVTDHTKANTELKAVAAKKNVTVPPAPAQEQQDHINDLKTKKGAEFDKAYVDMMVDDHKEDISKFEDEAKNGKDADVKAFAAKTLPVLRKHMAAIQVIQNGMKK